MVLSLRNLGKLYGAQGHYDKAEPLYRRALAIREQALGAEHQEVAKSLEELAEVLRQAGRAQEAEALQARAAVIRGQRSPQSTRARG